MTSHPLKKVLFKNSPDDSEPRDIAGNSEIIRALRDVERIQRVYAPKECVIDNLYGILDSISGRHDSTENLRRQT
jgi:hypothetical protein